jgi:hypothetical protein
MKRLKVRRWHGYLLVILVVTMASLGFFNMGVVKNQQKNSPINIVKTPIAEAKKEQITTLLHQMFKNLRRRCSKHLRRLRHYPLL